MRLNILRFSTLPILLFLVSSSLYASGQELLTDPELTRSKIFWEQLYPDGGETFFCGKKFQSATSKIKVDYLLPINTIRDSLKCGTRNQCLQNKDFQRVASDLHNMVPATKKMIRLRRNLIFGEVSKDEDQGNRLKCNFRTAYQTLQPSEDAKGNVARALFYMSHTYNIRIQGRLKTLITWHEEDPADEAERARNRLINQIQGTSNIFIDNPKNVDELIR